VKASSCREQIVTCWYRMQREEVQLQEEVHAPPFPFQATFALNLNLFLQLREAEAEYERAEFELQQTKAQQVIIALRHALHI
jgi:hypothetical protein